MSSFNAGQDLRTMIVARLQELCNDAGGQVTVTHEMKLGELALDSLKLVELIFELESKLAVQTNEEQLAQLETVEDIVHMFDHAVRAAA